jgi:hypothetical protein
MAKQDNGLTREALRNINRGQIEYQIRRLTKALDSANTVDDELKIHDRLIKYRDSLARITGLNSETVEHNVQLTPLQIVRSTPIVDITPTQ